MANELQAYLPTGKTLYAVLLNDIGQVWDGTQFETIAAGTWTDNDIVLTEATAGIYLADMPSVVAGAYSYLVYEQAGASPSITDSLLGSGMIDWDGAAVLPLTALARTGADSDTLETLSDQLDVVQAKTDLLDVSSVTVRSAISGTAITILRGDTFECSISDLGSLASYVSLDFTVKANKSQADSDALIRIRLNASGSDDGLLILNGAVPSNASDGSITITDAAAGDITITLAASCTDDLAAGTYAYDVQLIEAGKVSTLTSGKATVVADVTRAVS